MPNKAERERRYAHRYVNPRLLLGVLTVMFAVTAWQGIAYSGTFIPMPRAWSVMAAIAAFGCAMTALFVPTPALKAAGDRRRWVGRLLHFLEWRGWYVSAGAFAAVACLTRAVGLAVMIVADSQRPDSDAMIALTIGVPVWAALGVFILATWFALIIPWHVRARRWGS